jgi:hypothetical protein
MAESTHHLMIPFLLSLLCAIAVAPVPSARADDAYTPAFGGAVLSLKENTSISMVDEYVRIVVHESSYTVNAYFKFFNSGPSTTTTVGFPIGGDSPGQLTNFKTWVNGVEARVIDMPRHSFPTIEGEDGVGEFPEAWKVKTVDFPSKTFTRTSVQYSSPFGMRAESPTRYTVSYTYGTGMTWAGPIQSAVFDFHFDDNDPFIFPCSDRYKLIARDKGQIVFEMQNRKPQSLEENIGFNFKRMPDLVKFHVGGLGPSGMNMSCNIPEADWGMPFYCSNFISGSLSADQTSLDGFYGCGGDLRYLTLRQLRVLRNTFYATRGRVFKDRILQDYFDSLPWYRRNRIADVSKIEAPWNKWMDAAEKLTPREEDMVNRILKQEETIRNAVPFKPAKDVSDSN